MRNEDYLEFKLRYKDYEVGSPIDFSELDGEHLLILRSCEVVKNYDRFNFVLNFSEYKGLNRYQFCLPVENNVPIIKDLISQLYVVALNNKFVDLVEIAVQYSKFKLVKLRTVEHFCHNRIIKLFKVLKVGDCATPFNENIGEI